MPTPQEIAAAALARINGGVQSSASGAVDSPTNPVSDNRSIESNVAAGASVLAMTSPGTLVENPLPPEKTLHLPKDANVSDEAAAALAITQAAVRGGPADGGARGEPLPVVLPKMKVEDLRALLAEAEAREAEEREKLRLEAGGKVGLTFFSRLHNSVIHVQPDPLSPVIKPAQFVNDRLYTEDEDIIDYLSKIANKPGCPIYTFRSGDPEEEVLMREDIRANAIRAIERIRAAGVAG